MPGRVIGGLGKLLELVPDAAVAVDRDGVIVAANDSATRLFAAGPGSLDGRTVESLLPEPFRARHAALRRSFHDQSPTTRSMGSGRPFAALRGDGTEFQAEISLTPLEGAPTLIVAAVRDVTDRLRMESHLRDRLVVEQLVSRVAAQLVGASGTDLDRCIIDGLRQVTEAVGADQCLLYGVDETGSALILRHEWCTPDLDPTAGRVQRLPRTFAWSRDSLVQGEVTFIRSVEELPEQASAERAFMEQAGIVSAAAIPLGSSSDHVGTLALRWRTHRAEWSPETAPLLRVLGDTFLSALRRRDAEESHRSGERRHATVLASLAEAIVLLDAEGRVVEHNAAAARLLGEGNGGDVPVFPPSDWYLIDDDGNELQAGSALPWTEALRTGTARTEALIGAVRPGDPTRWLSVNALPLRDDRLAGQVVVSLVDVTSRREVEHTLARLALHDPLTGLANRTLLHDRVEHDLALARRDGSMVALLFCDLDGFKAINDRDGHAIGDEVLKAVAHRLTTSVRPTDTIARVGGDEFVVLASVDDVGQGTDLARRIIRSLHAPLEVHGHPTIGISIGIATARPDEALIVGAEDLVRRADRAMYRSKADGGGRWTTASADDRSDVPGSLTVRVDQALRDALAEDRFTVVYQPIVRLVDHTTIGAEALLRLRDGDALLEPADFIAQLESSDLASRVGRDVLRHACRAAMRWRTAAPRSGVTVNLSLRHLMSPDLARTIREELAESGLPPAALHMEITESSLIAGGAVDRLHVLRDLGVRVGLDDFGTGYASLTHLRTLPIDFLKIDRSFVTGLVDDHRDQQIVGAILRLSRDLDLDVIVEGIETEDEERLLLDLGAAYGQGYLYARPCSDTDVHEVLGRGVVARAGHGAGPGAGSAPGPGPTVVV